MCFSRNTPRQARSQVVSFLVKKQFEGAKILFFMFETNFSEHNKTWGALPPK